MKILKIIYVVSLCFTLNLTQNDVRLPPSITTGAVNKNLIYRNDDRPIQLGCRGTGVPDVTYEWKKNGFILNQDSPNIQRGADGTIRIQSPTSMDEGFYQCLVRNQFGTALSGMVRLQRAFIEVPFGIRQVLTKIVQEGVPFHIQADPPKSFPKSTYSWQTAKNSVDLNPITVQVSQRIQIAENGDLHFAYALEKDENSGKIYKLSTYNEGLDVSVGGSYTQLKVTRNETGNFSEFAPTLAFSAAAQTVAFVGGSVTLRCFFYGCPEPNISWSGKVNTLLSGRYKLNSFNTELTINSITAADEGDYTCTASNTQGRNTHTLQIRVEEVPKFRSVKDGPYDVNVTEGESFTFNCNANAKPEAKIVWLQDGVELNVNNPPGRFAFSSDMKRLTISYVCRDCVDRENETDLMVIQCNASNVHGYAFAQGYLNVLMKTEAMIRSTGLKEVSVDFRHQKHFIFQCYVTSDPSTPPTVQWFKTEPFGDLVRNELPYILVEKEFLIIMIYPNCSSECSKYLGEYRCTGGSNYSSENQTITLSYQYRPSPEIVIQKEEPWELWKIIVGSGIIGLILFLIGMFLGFRSKRSIVTNGHTKERNQPNPYSMYDRIIYDSVGVNPQALGNTGESMRRAISVYEHPGYDSIDQVLEDMTRGEQHVPYNSSDANVYNGYESIDEPQRNRGRPMLESDCSIPSTIALEAVTSHDYIDANRVDGCESVGCESRGIPNSIEQSETMNIYSDQRRQEINSYLDLGAQEDHHYLELCSKEVNPGLDMGQNEVNPYLEMDKKEMDGNLYTGPDPICLSVATAPEADYLVLEN